MKTPSTNQTICLIVMTTLLVVALAGGVAFAGSCNSDVKSTWVYTSPLTGKKYKIDTKIDKHYGIKTTTATELKNVTKKSWALTSPRVRLTYDITGDEGKNVVRIEDGKADSTATDLRNDHENTYGPRVIDNSGNVIGGRDDSLDDAEERNVVTGAPTASVRGTNLEGNSFVDRGNEPPADIYGDVVETRENSQIDRDHQAQKAYQSYLAIKNPNLAPLSKEQFTTIYNRLRTK